MAATLYAEDYRAFVEHVIALRRSRGVTQDQLAEQLGKPQSYVSKSERFERRLDVAEFRAFVIAIGADPAEEFAKVVKALSR